MEGEWIKKRQDKGKKEGNRKQWVGRKEESKRMEVWMKWERKEGKW